MQFPLCDNKPITEVRSFMHIDLIQTREAWAALADEWNALLVESHTNNPFLTYEFQTAWWRHKGGGEWPDAELHILTARDVDGALMGIAPLFKAEDAERRQALMLIGSHEIADFLDLIVRPQDHRAFSAALLEHLSNHESPGWDVLDLSNLLEDSATLEVFGELAQETPWPREQNRLQASPYIPIPADLDEYFAMLNAKQAHELRRKMRRAANNAIPIRMEIVKQAEDLEQALDDFFQLMTQEADKAAFLTAAMRLQMEAIARAAFENGWLQLAFLKVGNDRAAAYLNFDYDNRIWAYNSGFDSRFAPLSPGWLLMVEMLQWCIAQGREVFDFMRGDEEYKYRFGAIDRFVWQVEIVRQLSGSGVG